MQVGAALYVGHDLGTGRNKAVLVDARGEIHATASMGYPLSHPAPGWAEQGPAEWWRAVAWCTRSLLEQAREAKERVAGIGFAGQMLGLVPMANACEPSRPAISWLDSRGEEEAARIIRRLGGG